MKPANNWQKLLSMGLLVPLFGAAVVGDAMALAPPRCAGSGIAVPQWSTAERDRVCAAAEAAIGLLRDAGLTYRDGLTIRPLVNAPAQYRGSEVGHFDIERNEIHILRLVDLEQSTRLRSAFEVPMSAALWSSYISHEVAHAVAEQHFAPGVRRFTASEYIAAVVQLVTMAPELRESILARFADLEPYRSADSISSLYYLMAPGQFAVKVYRHYLGLGDAGPAFMQRLLRHGLSK